MTYTEFLSAIEVLTTTYSCSLSEKKLKVREVIFIDLDAELFRQAITQHIIDPDQGRFVPTPAHIVRHLVQSDDDIKLTASQAFDNDLCIDGSSTWNANRESVADRRYRKQRYVSEYLALFKRKDLQAKINQNNVYAIGGKDAS